MKLSMGVFFFAIVGFMLILPMVTMGLDRGTDLVLWMGLIACTLLGIIAILSAIQIGNFTKNEQFDVRKLEKFNLLACFFVFAVSIITMMDSPRNSNDLRYLLQAGIAVLSVIAATGILWKRMQRKSL